MAFLKKHAFRKFNLLNMNFDNHDNDLQIISFFRNNVLQTTYKKEILKSVFKD